MVRAQKLFSVVENARKIGKQDTVGSGWCRHVREYILQVGRRDRIETRGRYLRACCSTCSGRRDCRADRELKNALPLLSRGNNRGLSDRRGHAAHFLGEEEERLFLTLIVELGNEERPADGAAKIVVTKDRARIAISIVDKTVRVEHIVTEKLVESPVERGSAGARNYVDLPGSRAAEFRRIVASLDFEFRNGVHTGIHQQGNV